jgi:MFS transporter, DHA1 family, tetracycline resistance protein
MPADPSPATPARPTTRPGTRAGLWPLLGAGFVTAFGAHAIAATLGRYASDRHASLIQLGVLLALYDGAEVFLKPAFGALADRIGPPPGPAWRAGGLRRRLGWLRRRRQS